MAKFNTGQSFADGDTVTGAKLNNITGLLDIYSGVIADQTAITATVSTADLLLIADTDAGSSGAANKVTVQKLLNDTLTGGTFTNANLSEQLTYGTATGNRTVSTSATITTGTINGLSTTTGTVATLNSTTGTIAGLNSTNGTVQTLTASTATITGGTYSGAINSTTGTVATLNSTTGTITNLRSTTGTVATLNSTTGTITGLNTTTGTIATLNSTTGTITNLSTTLAGDFTISQGTGTIGASKVTPSQLSQPLTLATAVASTSGTAIDFTSIPSWVKRITLIFNEVSTSGISPIAVQLGKSGGVETTGYSGFGTQVASSSNALNIVQSTANTIGFNLSLNSAAGDSTNGNATIFNISGNIWVFSSNVTRQTVILSFGNGAKTLSGTLDRIRITTVNGTDTFDAGSVNIMYEG